MVTIPGRRGYVMPYFRSSAAMPSATARPSTKLGTGLRSRASVPMDLVVLCNLVFFLQFLDPLGNCSEYAAEVVNAGGGD